MAVPQIEYKFTVHRVGNDPLRFKLCRTIDELRNAGERIERGLAANYFGVVLDDKLIIVPAHQVALIEIEPAPKALIAHVIRDAEPI